MNYIKTLFQSKLEPLNNTFLIIGLLMVVYLLFLTIIDNRE